MRRSFWKLLASSVLLTGLLSTAALAADPPNPHVVRDPRSQVVKTKEEDEKDRIANPPVYERTSNPVIEHEPTKRRSADRKPGGDVSILSHNRIVTVRVAVDEEYRTAHSDWQTRVQDIVEKADDYFNATYHIDFTVDSLAYWFSAGANSSAILSDLNSDWNDGTYDLVIGFTADPNFTDGGLAYQYSSDPTLSGVNANLDQSYDATWHVVMHEVSHNYGLGHDASGSGITCIMNYDTLYSTTVWDSDHQNTLELHRSWYGTASPF